MRKISQSGDSAVQISGIGCMPRCMSPTYLQYITGLAWFNHRISPFSVVLDCLSRKVWDHWNTPSTWITGQEAPALHLEIWKRWKEVKSIEKPTRTQRYSEQLVRFFRKTLNSDTHGAPVFSSLSCAGETFFTMDLRLASLILWNVYWGAFSFPFQPACVRAAPRSKAFRDTKQGANVCEEQGNYKTQTIPRLRFHKFHSRLLSSHIKLLPSQL